MNNEVKMSQNEKPVELKKKPIIEFLDVDEEKVYASEMGGNYCSDVC